MPINKLYTINNSNYNNSTYEYESVSCYDVTSFSFCVYSDSSSYSFTIYFLMTENDNVVNAIDSSSQTGLTGFFKYDSTVKSAYIKILLDDLTNPCILQSQLFFFQSTDIVKTHSIDNFPVVQKAKLTSLDQFDNQVVLIGHPIVQYVFNNSSNVSGSTLPNTGFDDIVLESDSSSPANQQTIQIYNNVLWVGVKSIAGTPHTYTRVKSNFLVSYRAGIVNVLIPPITLSH